MSEPASPADATPPETDDLIPLGPAPEMLRAAAAELGDRQRQVADLLRELADRREQFRRERSPLAGERKKLRRAQAQADRLRKAARADRIKARTLYARFLRRMKAKWSAERAAVAAERTDLDHRRREFLDEVKRYEGEHAILAYESEEYRKRLHDAWALLTDGQRRLVADRREAERAAVDREAAVRERAAALDAREKRLAADRRQLDGRADELRAEIARLELRAAHARAAVQQLEDRRRALETSEPTADGPTANLPVVIDQIPLDRHADRGVGQLLTELNQREYELGRERAALIAVRAELERRAAELVDQRAVVAEQVASLAAVRRLWQAAECRTVEEIEALARGLDRRDLDLRDRERRVAAAERELHDLRTRLEAWQSALTAHEVAAAAARDRLAIDLAAKRDRLARWESALATLCRKWATARKREVTRLREEVARWSDERVRHRLALAEQDDVRRGLLAEAARVAEHALALEQVQADLAGSANGPAAERRLRVHRRQWDAYFTRFLTDVDARRRQVAAESGQADDRLHDLARRSVAVAERQAEVAAAEQRAEADRLVCSRELDERTETLSIEAARAARTHQELDSLRAEVERLAAALAVPHDEAPDVVPLALPARAA